MKLIVQPDDGLKPLLQRLKRARKSIDIVIFRFDRLELEKALESAVARGVVVRALIAHTNTGGEKNLRKLELRLLESGITVARTADDLPRYHGKMMIVDNVLYVLGFNYTKLDIEKSRSFGLMTADQRLVKEAASLFEADRTRQPYSPSHNRLVVSPETSRELLTAFIRGARKQLLIYDEKVSDKLIQRVLQDRVRRGVEIRVIGKLEKPIEGILTRKVPDLRLHVRAMVRDAASAFLGSQSLRKLELDGRREVGVIVNDSRIAKKMQAVFEADWAQAGGGKWAEKAEKRKGGKTADKNDKGVTEAVSA
ncbi:MAG TPA: phospholipase D-like domain-containing protein [Vicinamibacterales bacterium]|nr:phospholipase D-like domain-containing protein [Vicinamibacterales bacterium]